MCGASYPHPSATPTNGGACVHAGIFIDPQWLSLRGVNAFLLPKIFPHSTIHLTWLQQLRLVTLVDHGAVAGGAGVGGVHGFVNVAPRDSSLGPQHGEIIKLL